MMGFFVPDHFARFSIQVEKRFTVLIQKRVLTGIDVLQLRSWLANYESEEERYLAAHLLDSLIFRSEKMIESSSHQVLEMILPNALKSLNLFRATDLNSFLQRIAAGDEQLGIRFVAVDGQFEKTPGKSGAALIRIFGRATGIPNNLLVRPENISRLHRDARVLVFLDDCLGTGTQFKSFCDYYRLQSQAQTRTLIYVPYVAHSDGIAKLAREFPNLLVRPVEVLGESANFFAGDLLNPLIWRRDKSNTVQDVEVFYRKLLERRGVRPNGGAFNLNLSLAFSISTPNNTLKAFYSEDGQWSKLVTR